ncbi:MAG: cobyric acid synthase [Acidobacteria bacterium]|nr:cobyric acid synthase [Acidobacteriota bacterium]
MTPALMILGTGSHVGKSLIAAGLGRVFANGGLRVAPFKAQNMSLNSAATPDGREIGRAQALQAEACRAVPCAEMNPVLIKPSSDTGAQIVVLGRVWGQVTAFDYHTKRVEQLFPDVARSYHALAAGNDLMVLEGAGSPAEINLREHDIVNMRMAHEANAACLLVGDIDRGGVFASLLGTLELLDAADRARIRGFLINKFRGDVKLLLPGIDMIEQRIGIPCAGVVPYLHKHGLEEEDGVAMEDRRTASRIWGGAFENSTERPLRIGVIALPHMANFTDFDALSMEPAVALAFVDDPRDLASADVVILPGTKQTLDDLAWLRRTGCASAVVAHGGPVTGICGGYQMLGRSLDDPLGVENAGLPREAEGLGLLPLDTILNADKTVNRTSGEVPWLPGVPFHGYEIHMGRTGEPAQLSATDEATRVCGTYIHGLFDDDRFRHASINRWREQCGLAQAREMAAVSSERDGRIERWAAHLGMHIKMDLLRAWLDILKK